MHLMFNALTLTQNFMKDHQTKVLEAPCISVTDNYNIS